MRAGAGAGLQRPSYLVTWVLIAVNVLLWFAYSGSAPHSMVAEASPLFRFLNDECMLWPLKVFGQGKVWQLFTCMWLHDPFHAEHLLFNMIALFFFGRVTETWLGTRGYLLLYLGAGLFASLVFTGWSLLVGQAIPALGASAAIFGVMVWLACQQPRLRVYMMMMIPMPMWLAVGVFIVGIEVVRFSGAPQEAGASVAHLSGAAFGAAAWFVHRHGPTRFRLGGARPRRAAGGGGPGFGPEQEMLLRAQVERLLAKISSEGIQSLSPEEKAFLEEAARRLRHPHP